MFPEVTISSSGIILDQHTKFSYLLKYLFNFQHANEIHNTFLRKTFLILVNLLVLNICLELLFIWKQTQLHSFAVL